MPNNIDTENTITYIIAGGITKLVILVIILWIFIVNVPILFSGNFSFWNILFVAIATITSLNIIKGKFKKK